MVGGAHLRVLFVVLLQQVDTQVGQVGQILQLLTGRHYHLTGQLVCQSGQRSGRYTVLECLLLLNCLVGSSVSGNGEGLATVALNFGGAPTNGSHENRR